MSIIGWLLDAIVLLLLALIVYKQRWQKNMLEALDERLPRAISQHSQKSSIATTRQLEELLRLCLRLELQPGALPPTRGYAASPDFLNVLVDIVRERQPERVLELGSGVSSIVLGYLAEQHQAMAIFSIDHQEQYAEETRMRLSAAGVAGHVRVHVAPLREQTFFSERKLWYDWSRLPLDNEYDLIVVDGPPIDETGSKGREPVIELCGRALRVGGQVVFDDAYRPGEQSIIARLAEEHGYTVSERVAEKGCVVLTKHSTPLAQAPDQVASGQSPPP
ncbi:MAG: class I SAM-dependent methyltransferase [Spiribacter salinus]|uniref:Class I SAM-dependent methyltransferase n=1 Tax=Spiribacter salinus TaxID=1335746 RepID=A0A540VS82_9GAMM|nr:MAG: class I SAM-dependent methyltransferase [Spiribacter salinus]